MSNERWTLRLASAAETDIRQILRWTTRHFGAEQARNYRATLSAALQVLYAGPEHLAVKQRDEILPGLKSLHVRCTGRAGRHLILFRADTPFIDVLRILHDSMDVQRHLPPGPGK